jgi:hypothetical protein
MNNLQMLFLLYYINLKQLKNDDMNKSDYEVLAMILFQLKEIRKNVTNGLQLDMVMLQGCIDGLTSIIDGE